MPSFRHKRTGKIIQVDERDAFRFNNARFEVIVDSPEVTGVNVGGEILVPEGTVAQLLDWAGDDYDRREALYHAEKAGKNRKGIIEALS